MSNKENIVNLPDVQKPGIVNVAEPKDLSHMSDMEPEIDDPQFLCALRKLIYKIFTVDKEIPTLPKVLIEAKNQLNFNGSKSLLRKILKAKLGFKYKRCKNNGPIPMERHKIAYARINYLTDLSKNDSLGDNKQPVVYVDETLIYLDEAAKDPNNVWCIMHAGGENGFLDGASLVYKCVPKKKVHNLIGKKKFLKWLKLNLLSNLPPNSIVVYDDAPQHNELKETIPDFDSSKQSIIEWLQKHNVEFSNNDMRLDLLQLVTNNMPKNNYAADNILTEAGHTVLRLPIYCGLSPMENIYGLIKKRVAENQAKDPQAQFDEIIKNAIASVTKLDWEREMKNVKQLEKEYDESEHKLDNETEKLDISFEESESEVYSFSSSDGDYDTDFSATDDSDDNSYVSSDGSYISIGYEYDVSDDSDRMDSYNI